LPEGIPGVRCGGLVLRSFSVLWRDEGMCFFCLVPPLLPLWCWRIFRSKWEMRRGIVLRLDACARCYSTERRIAPSLQFFKIVIAYLNEFLIGVV
jgi:hypothetical protein